MEPDLDDELLVEFINESREHLTAIEAELLAIEEGGADIDAELVNKVFRAAHSIKGASGYFGLTKVKELAHRAETVLDMIRSRKMIPNAEITNLLLATFDQLRTMINRPAESDQADIGELVQNLTDLAASYLPRERKMSLTQNVRLNAPGCPPVVLSSFEYDSLREDGRYLYSVEYDLIHDIERRGRNVLEVFRTLMQSGEILDCEVNFEAVGTLDGPICNQLPLRLLWATTLRPREIDPLFPYNREKVKTIAGPGVDLPEESFEQRTAAAAAMIGDESSAGNAVSVPPLQPLDVEPGQPMTVAISAKTSGIGSAAAPATLAEESIRVNIGTLETLMNLAGELMLGRNQLRASIAQKNARALKAADQRINQITSELQDVVMQTRLQPIGNVFGKFPRLVRDLSAALHKDVQLEIRGREVAMDRSLIESLSDPLTHMVRNAVDHGVELPEERVKSGKSRQAQITIDARHEAGQVVVEISDDGRGIDPERIAKAALAKGLIAAEKLQGMSARDKTFLVFLPGLSTNTQVSDISGRGVGMDVVKTNLDRLGGKVEIISVLGKGTTFRIKLPLTLAIIPSLIVSVEGERFAIPQINVEEIRRILPGQAKTRIEVVGDAEVLLLRDRMIPLVRFADMLGVVPTYADPASGLREINRRSRMADRRSPRVLVEADSEEAAPVLVSVRKRADRRQSQGALEIVVVTTGAQTYGLVVDAFHDTEEIVVKPLGSHLKGLEEYAGATILGDGSLALILDVAGLAAIANLDAVGRLTEARGQTEGAADDKFADSHSLLLFHNSPEELCALPLEIVSRIEHIEYSQVEVFGGRRTMKYHGGSLPLVTLADTAHVNPIGDGRKLAVMIANIRGHQVGLLGAMPVDVVETSAAIDQVTHRQKGVNGSAIIRERTALIVDLYEVVDAAWPEWAEQQLQDKPRRNDAGDAFVLVAEDSNFFRSQIQRFLEEDGYPVLAAEDGEAAWGMLLEHVEKVRLVVTDIEMPQLDGLGLARRIRADQRTAHLPIIALTSLAGDDDMARGKAAGIDEYQTKIDRDQLLERVRAYWSSPADRARLDADKYAAA
jgi:two-component system, chemotaxis family, sensor kinase CheA